jgi:hypothetical protein
MIKILFDFDIDGTLQEEAFLDRYELDYLFRQTRESIAQSLERKLEAVLCHEHQQAPTITISGRYNGETEQMDIEYHIDTCCQLFLVQVVSILNTVN